MTAGEQAEEAGPEQEAAERAEQAPDELDVYPLRDASEDPRWAMWVVGIWLGFAIFCLLGILALVILGFFYT